MRECLESRFNVILKTYIIRILLPSDRMREMQMLAVDKKPVVAPSSKNFLSTVAAKRDQIPYTGNSDATNSYPFHIKRPRIQTVSSNQQTRIANSVSHLMKLSAINCLEGDGDDDEDEASEEDFDEDSISDENFDGEILD